MNPFINVVASKELGVECRLVLALTYWREYRGMRQIAFDYDLSVFIVGDEIKWVELILEKHLLFQLEDIKTEIKNRNTRCKSQKCYW